MAEESKEQVKEAINSFGSCDTCLFWDRKTMCNAGDGLKADCWKDPPGAWPTFAGHIRTEGMKRCGGWKPREWRPRDE